VPTSALIIEGGGVFITMDWEAELEDLGHSVVKSVDTIDSAQALASELRPGLILAGTLFNGAFAHAALDEIARSCDASLVIRSRLPEASLTGERVEAAYVMHKRDSIGVLDAVIKVALATKRAGLSDCRLPDADVIAHQLRGQEGVIISTEAARQFASGVGLRSNPFGLDRSVHSRVSDDTLGPALHQFLEHFGYDRDVVLVSYPTGLVAWRSHATIILRKSGWTTPARFYEIMATMQRELRDPPRRY
jgi:hypothetical protein